MMNTESKIDKITSRVKFDVVLSEQSSSPILSLEKLDDLLRELRECGVSIVALHAAVRLYLNEDEDMTLGKLARSIGMSRAAITHVVDLVEDLGVARRIANKHDRRSAFVRLTPSGRALARWASFKLAGAC
jgi:DNA-binding MarR family transcriptional regulator